MALRVSTRVEGDVCVITATGELDFFAVRTLRDACTEAFEHKRDLYVDLNGVTCIDTPGLAAIVGALKRTRVHKLRFGIICDQQTVLNALRLTRLSKVFTIYPSLQAITQEGQPDLPTSTQLPPQAEAAE